MLRLGCWNLLRNIELRKERRQVGRGWWWWWWRSAQSVCSSMSSSWIQTASSERAIPLPFKPSSHRWFLPPTFLSLLILRFFLYILLAFNWIVISMASRDVFPLLIFLCVCSGNVHVLKHQSTLKAISLLMTFRAAKSNLASESENLPPKPVLIWSICFHLPHLIVHTIWLWF